MSTLKVDTLQTTAGAGLYTAKAWVNFDGTGTVAIRDDGNVSSITDNGTGDYTLTFDNALSSSNYAGFYLAGNLGGGGYSLISPFAVSTTSLEIDQANKNGDKIDRDMVTLGVVL
jgi:hypothetical protein